MPRIINAYEGNSATGDMLSKLGEAIYGDQAKNEVFRQKGLAQKTLNDLVTGPAGLDDPMLAKAQLGIGGTAAGTFPGQGRSLANDRSIAGGHDAASRANNAASNAETRYSTDRRYDSDIATTGMNNTTSLAAADMTSKRTAATQDAMDKRQQDRLSYEFEHKPVILYNRNDGRSVQVMGGSEARAMQSQGWEPIAAEPPKTQSFKTQSGDDAQAQWNRSLNRWERFDPDTLPPVTPTPQAASAIPGAPAAPQPFNGRGSAMPVNDATPAAQNSPGATNNNIWNVRPDNPSSLRAPTAVPPGVNGPAYRSEMAKKSADSNAMLQDQTAGAIDFLKASGRAKEIYKRSPDVFGPWAGQPVVNDYVRAPKAYLGSSTAAANMEHFNEVESITKELASAGLKGLYGARPTNIDLTQNNAMFGGLRSANSETAIRLVEEQEMKHLATISRALNEGLIRPENIDPQVVALGIKKGVLDPRMFPAPTAGAPSPAAAKPPSVTQNGHTYNLQPDGSYK